MKLTHMAKAGDADVYVLELDDGAQHKFIASNAEKCCHPQGHAGVIAEKVARIMAKASHG